MQEHVRRLPRPLLRLAGAMRPTHGATSTEYALLLVLITVVLVISVRYFGSAVVNLFRTYPELISS